MVMIYSGVCTEYLFVVVVVDSAMEVHCIGRFVMCMNPVKSVRDSLVSRKFTHALPFGKSTLGKVISYLA